MPDGGRSSDSGGMILRVGVVESVWLGQGCCRLLEWHLQINEDKTQIWKVAL